MDIGTLKPGQRYRMLKDSYVMFICTENPFGSGRAVYTFENRCEEEPGCGWVTEAGRYFIMQRGTPVRNINLWKQHGTC